MLEQLRESLEEYIRDSQTLRVVYAGRTFECEPYLLYEAKNGNLYLHCYKTSGEYEKVEPPHWASLRLDFLESIEPIGTYLAPILGYNPKSKLFHKVLFEWRLNEER